MGYHLMVTKAQKVAGRYLGMTPQQLAEQMAKHPGALAADILTMAGYIVNDAPGRRKEPTP